MTVGSGGFAPDDASDVDPRPTAGRVFSLDDGGLVPVQEMDGDSRPTAPALVTPSLPTVATPAAGGTIVSGEAPTLGWEDISPDRLRESAAEHQARGVFGDADVVPAVGMAWYEVILGCLLGLAGTLWMYKGSDGTLGPLVVGPSLILGLILLAIPRHDVRHLGLGLLASVPVAALLGFGLWYVTVLT